uniref:tRNA/rRNA methyltransferase SpoU type domain-containing protein n=1 Tax=Odontella aurita TaxID=265563 RepID=A0A7S4IL60_9STRA|mmetsp:Transcript_26741/g.79000  ORF Transcript_26741/g.79000 Transcript_26741/m.79000 type:complete len:288 (+) Transcript_26741:199-1062(+)
MDNIRIVLVRTYASGNIGSTARAMKTMGLKHLSLVAPRLFPDHEATKMATRGAETVLNRARVVDSLYDAVRDCEVVIACTARSRSFNLPMLSTEQAAKLLYSTANRTARPSTEEDSSPAPSQSSSSSSSSPSPSVALVFGPERNGLDGADMELAQYRVSIPAHPDSTSLNLASAVQILSYELRKYHIIQNDENALDREETQTMDSHNSSSSSSTSSTRKKMPTIAQREGFYEVLASVLSNSGFAHADNPRQLMQKMRHLLARAEPDLDELNLLRGALAAIRRHLPKK